MESLALMPRYEAYKESGVDWLGCIPKSWNVIPVKRRHQVIKLINKRNHCDNVLSLTLRGVVNNNLDNPEGLVPRDYASYQIFEKDDLVFKLIDLENLRTSRVGIVHERGIMSPAYIRLKINDQYHPRYAYYYFYDLYLNAVFNSLGEGVRSTLGPTDLLKIAIVEPPHNEQIAIASFLDKKLIQIDEAIAIKEQQISLLKERNQIVIQQAMIQGLDPNVPMKDSGIDWIGNIPEHWEVVKLKHLFSENTQRTKTGNEILFSLRMELGLVPHDDVSDKPIPAENLVDYKIVKSGQLVMNRMRASIGIFGLASDFGLVSPDYAVFDVAETVRADYYLALFKMPLMWTQFRLASKGMGTGSSGFMRLYTDEFGDIKVAKPPKQEQESLMQFIEKTNISTAAGVEHIQFQIEKLKEYKTTLINSAVTGKIKITPEMVEQ